MCRILPGREEVLNLDTVEKFHLHSILTIDGNLMYGGRDRLTTGRGNTNDSIPYFKLSPI